MPSSAIANTLLAYEPIIERKRRAIAMRFTARSSGREPVDVPGLVAGLSELWPEWSIPVQLRVPDVDTLPAALLDVAPTTRVWLELPATMTATVQDLQLAAELHRKGFVLVLGGRPYGRLPPALLAALRMAVIHVEEDRRLQAGAAGEQRGFIRSIPYAQAGVQSIEMLKRSFEAGAAACIGWPFEDANRHAAPSDANPDFTNVTQLLALIDRDADPAELDKVIRRDAALAYRLLRYINSAAFGLTVEVQSFQHAVMMLGYERLKRWLLLMLVTASKDANLQPVMFASFRRGLLMEHLVGADGDPGTRDAVFILGVLSLLDKMFREPMPSLLSKLNVAEGIREALIERTGPYAAYLRVAEAVEREPDGHLVECLDHALVSVEQCNRALIKAVTVKEVVAP